MAISTQSFITKNATGPYTRTPGTEIDNMGPCR